MTVIDLGDVSDPSARTGDYPSARRRGWDRATLRRRAPAVVAVLCALLLGGSAVPDPPALRKVWSLPFAKSDSMSLAKDTLYVNRAAGLGSELTAYDVATGVARWKLPTTRPPSWNEIVPTMGVLLMPGDEQWAETELENGTMLSYVFGGTVTAVDPATGTQLWKQPGMQVYGDKGDTLLLFERNPAGTMTKLRLVRVRDGSVVWERIPDAGVDNAMIQLDGDKAARIITNDTNGAVQVLRYSDGAPVTTAQVEWTPLSPATGMGSNISLAGSLVIVVDNGNGKSVATAYRSDTMEPLWTREFVDWVTVQECGPLLCVASLSFFNAVDPKTGETRWVTDGTPASWMLPDSDRLVVSGTDDAPAQKVVDPATGRPLGPVGRGRFLYRDGADGLVLMRTLFPDVTRVAVSRLDTRTGRVTMLGALPAPDDDLCDGEDGYLVCQNSNALVITAAG